MRLGETVTIDGKKISTNNKSLIESLQGRKAKIIDIIINSHERKLYFKLDIDKGYNTWSKDMLRFE